MEAYEIVISFVLPAVIFGQHCGPVKILQQSTLDIQKSRSSGAALNIIDRINSTHPGYCYEKCCSNISTGKLIIIL